MRERERARRERARERARERERERERQRERGRERERKKERERERSFKRFSCGRYNCTCNEEYEGDGIKSCTIEWNFSFSFPEVPCGGKCGENAECVEKDGEEKCQCNEGYQGDGYDCSSTY